MPALQPAIGHCRSVLSYPPCNRQPECGSQSATKPSCALSAAMPSGARRSFDDCCRSVAGRSLKRRSRATCASSVSSAPKPVTGLAMFALSRSAPMRINHLWKCSYPNSSTQSTGSASSSCSTHFRVVPSRSRRASTLEAGQRSSGPSQARILSSSSVALPRPARSSPSGSESWPASAD